MSSNEYNSIMSITLVGTPALGSGSIELKRAQPDVDLVPICRTDAYFRPYPPPPDHPHLPIPLHPHHLKLQLTDIIDDGGSSVVYAASVIHSESDASAQSYPPLVVKMARRCRRGHLAREAWFYDELHELQGSVVPRCYGWFEAPETTTFTGDAYAPDGDDDASLGEPSYYPEPWTEALGVLARQKGYISVLVLERLGPLMPIGVPLSATLQEDVVALGESLGAHYIHVVDIRRQNILHTLEDPGALPSEPSPVTQRVHAWRVIDLESCRKCDQPPKRLSKSWKSWVSNILDSLPRGYTVEPWEY